MNFPKYDTEWATSAKRNVWRRLNEKILVVGRKKGGAYWAMFNGEFIEGEFETESIAKKAAEQQCAKELQKREFI